MGAEMSDDITGCARCDSDNTEAEGLCARCRIGYRDEIISELFDVRHRCAECGAHMHRAVSLWRCPNNESEHQLIGPTITDEILSRLSPRQEKDRKE
jgi:hypothetical protein